MTGLPEVVDAALTLEDGVAILRFNRHDVRNALTGTKLADEIVTVCEWANACRDVATLVLTGNGSAFSAGGNVYDMQDRKGMFGGTPMEMQQDYRSGIQRMARAMHDVEVPTIAAINGAAIGAGMDLACMCDIRIGSQKAKMGETFVNLGILPGDGGAWFLPRAVGAQRAAELTFSGRIVEADEAVEIGLLMEVCPPDDLMPRCEDLARQFAAKPRDALRISKRLLRSGQRMGLPDFLDYCASLQSLCHTTEEHHEAIAAMIEQLRK
ncbi:enoyl-CoA hydratase [Croceicoccus estronivorus]|uniref:enoyl-CoA hydratase-related protein n=1 Tax=Croceicoccus estronivorus TaxID=1172626 RepID=UPI00082C118B|nr:enoyl-CoA hydratase-related protein [Croceicoccus estronivorus]OCC25629.1 enoyl-CoA hydratase [Croceicoccus estronivorus]